MNNTDVIDEALTHYLMHELRPIDHGRMCIELVRLGASDAVPEASESQWMQSLERLVEAGVVVCMGRRVAIDRQRLVNVKQKSSQEQQPSLF